MSIFLKGFSNLTSLKAKIYITSKTDALLIFLLSRLFKFIKINYFYRTHLKIKIIFILEYIKTVDGGHLKFFQLKKNRKTLMKKE